MLRHNAHWQLEMFKQRMTVKEWKKILLNHEDMIIVNGRLRQLRAKNLGAGVVEVYKEPLKEG